MWHVFSLTLKDQTGRTVRVYEVLAERGIQAVFSITVLCETAFVLANGGKAVLKERKY